MTRIIAVAVPKGGTGKTTTTINLAAALVEHGQRVLCVDFDPTGHLTKAMGVPASEMSETVYTAIDTYLTTYEPQLDRAIRHTSAGFDLAPTDVRLNLADGKLTLAPNGTAVLSQLLEPLLPAYDLIFIDTLPYLGQLARTALVAAHEVLVPIEAEPLAAESLVMMIQQVELMRRSRLNPHLQVLGVLFTMLDRTVMNRDVVTYVRNTFGTQVPMFDTVIRRTTKFPESQAEHKTILQYDAQGAGAQAYRALAEEIAHGIAHKI